MSPRMDRHARRYRISMTAAFLALLVVSTAAISAFAGTHSGAYSTRRYSPAPRHETRLITDCAGHDRSWMMMSDARIQHVCTHFGDE